MSIHHYTNLLSSISHVDHHLPPQLQTSGSLLSPQRPCPHRRPLTATGHSHSTPYAARKPLPLLSALLLLLLLQLPLL
jgi:hypothetical protein